MTRCGFLNERIIANALSEHCGEIPPLRSSGRVADKQEGTCIPTHDRRINKILNECVDLFFVN